MRHHQRANHLLAVAVAAVLAGSAAACSAGDGTPASDRTTDAVRTTDSGQVQENAGGEIWQWALGADAWNDARLARYSGSLGRSSSTNISVTSEGFELDLDATGTVVAVVVYNDETALGLPVSSSSFHAYPGVLPAGLTWADTGADVVGRFGKGSLLGGFGLEVSYDYTTDSGGGVRIAFAARTEDDVPGSLIHSITVT